MPIDDEEFSVPRFRREEMEGQREEETAPSGRATDGRYMRGLAFRISELLVRTNRSDYDLGALIDEVVTNGHFRQWPGHSYDKFADWTWGVLGFHSRKAEYLRRNYLALAGMHLSEIALTSAMRVGWSKLKEILRVARDEVTLFQWIDKINENNWSEKELKRALLEATGGSRTSMAGDPFGATPRSDEGGAAPEPTARYRFTAIFSELSDFQTARRAIENVARRYNPEMGDGKALAMIATSYLASVPRDDEGGAPVELEYLIRQIEQNYGVRLVVAEDGEDAPAAQTRDDIALDM